MAVAKKKAVKPKNPPTQYSIFETVLKMGLVIFAKPTNPKQSNTAMDRNWNVVGSRLFVSIWTDTVAIPMADDTHNATIISFHSSTISAAIVIPPRPLSSPFNDSHNLHAFLMQFSTQQQHILSSFSKTTKITMLSSLLKFSLLDQYSNINVKWEFFHESHLYIELLLAPTIH